MVSMTWLLLAAIGAMLLLVVGGLIGVVLVRTIGRQRGAIPPRIK
ncbi:MAG TPA: hypothetical protein PLI18_18440 [Pirellulaceae bacterium]|nr:hypothetical protein [Pirellulaceae bacterium]